MYGGAYAILAGALVFGCIVLGFLFAPAIPVYIGFVLAVLLLAAAIRWRSSQPYSQGVYGEKRTPGDERPVADTEPTPH